MKSITIESLERTDKDKVLVVDIRPEDQYQRGTFPGAVNLPMAEFEDRKTELELYKDKEIYLMILSILVYTLFSRMFDLMQPPAVKHSIAVV